MNLSKAAALLALAAVGWVFYKMIDKNGGIKILPQNWQTLNFGSHVNTLGYQDHNPINILWSETNNWNGQDGDNRSYAEFDYDWEAYRAGAIIFSAYRRQGAVTIRDYISKWAPARGNPTANYIKYVCQTDSLTPGTVVTSQNIARVLWAMTGFENGVNDVPLWYVKKSVGVSGVWK